MNICGAPSAFLKLQRMHSVPVSVGSKIEIVPYCCTMYKYPLTFDVFPVPCLVKQIHCIWMFNQNCVFGCCKDISLVDHFKGDNPAELLLSDNAWLQAGGHVCHATGIFWLHMSAVWHVCFKYSWENEKGIDYKKMLWSKVETLFAIFHEEII